MLLLLRIPSPPAATKLQSLLAWKPASCLRVEGRSLHKPCVKGPYSLGPRIDAREMAVGWIKKKDRFPRRNTQKSQGRMMGGWEGKRKARRDPD